MAQNFTFVFTTRVPEVEKATEETKQRALEKMGGTAETHAKKYSPVDTGHLKGSITHKKKDSNTMLVGTNVEYGIYQEFGTYKMGAHPFIRPAIENHINEYTKICADEFNKVE